MRSQLLVSVTSKLAAGTAAVILAAGSAGAVAMTQTISDTDTDTTTDEVVEVVDETGEGDLPEDGTLEEGTVEDGTGEEVPTDDVVSCPVEEEVVEEDAPVEGDVEAAELGADECVEDTDGEEEVPVEEGEETPTEHKNFGQMISEMRRNGELVGGANELAHEKNAARKAAQGEDEVPEEEVVEDEAGEDAVEAESTGGPGHGKGKGHGKK